MSVKTYNVVLAKPDPKREGKRFFVQLGVAFLNENGSINLALDAIPLNWDGKLVLFERDKD